MRTNLKGIHARIFTGILTGVLAGAFTGAFSPAGLSAERDQVRKADEKASPKGAGERKAGGRAGEKAESLPPLPPDKLPPRSGAPPDAAREQYRREKVHVRVGEWVKPKERLGYRPEVPVLQNHLSEYFRRAGFEVVDDPGAAPYRIEGKLEAKFDSVITFQGQVTHHKYMGSARLAVLGKDGTELEVVEVPTFYKDGLQTPGKTEDEVAVLEMRRHLAKIVWERLFHNGKTFTDPEVPELISSLAGDDLEDEAPVQAAQVLSALVAKRLAAVPYLIEALSDERTVRVNARYPGVTSANADKLRIYHLADKALEEIFQKVSRLELGTPSRARFMVIRGWEKEWRRFCPSFRDSPLNRPKETADEAGGAAEGQRK